MHDTVFNNNENSYYLIINHYLTGFSLITLDFNLIYLGLLIFVAKYL